MKILKNYKKKNNANVLLESKFPSPLPAAGSI